MVPDLDALEATLLNIAGDVKLDVRFRTLFTLKGISSFSEDKRVRVIDILGRGLSLIHI